MSLSRTSEAQAVKLLQGDQAPYFGILISEPRYRQFRTYEAFYKESPRVTEELLELRIKNQGLEKECECTPVKDAFLWVFVGVVVGFLLPHP